LVYKIAARNQWGTVPFSRPNLEIDVAQKPDKITNIKINDSGMVRISWNAPDSTGGSIISFYTVEIQNSLGAFVAPANDCRPGTTDIKEATDIVTSLAIHLCRIDMGKMVTEFGLAYNDPIVARVMATNAANLGGPWGESDDSAKVKTEPLQMPAKPRRGTSTDALTLHVIWDEMTTSTLTGGSDIIYYSVFKEGDTENAVYTTSGTSYLYNSPLGSLLETEVKFSVAASNIYGTGELSEFSDAI